jgi:hypothetical protein
LGLHDCLQFLETFLLGKMLVHEGDDFLLHVDVLQQDENLSLIYEVVILLVDVQEDSVLLGVILEHLQLSCHLEHIRLVILTHFYLLLVILLLDKLLFFQILFLSYVLVVYASLMLAISFLTFDQIHQLDDYLTGFRSVSQDQTTFDLVDDVVDKFILGWHVEKTRLHFSQSHI